jgi:hypothetical protein
MRKMNSEMTDKYDITQQEIDDSIERVKLYNGQKYKCPECGWIGTEKEMEADYAYDEGDAFWSNTICPMCHAWHSLDDYEKDELE